MILPSIPGHIAPADLCAFALWTHRVKLIAGVDDLDAGQRVTGYAAFFGSATAFLRLLGP